MKPRCILFTMAAILFAISCGKTQEEVKPEIKIPTESQAVFSSGISFPENQGNSTQSTVVSFTATESWSSDVIETKASSWLSVQPSSGGAGIVNMSVTAQPNTGEAARSAMVTIKCGTVTKSFTVTQAGNPPTTVAVESVTLNKTELELEPGASETLTATVAPESATDKTVTWSTSNAEVATVESGKVTAVKEGEATITAKVGEKEATCKVTVKSGVIAVTSITLNKTSLSLTKGQSETLTATVSPSDATDRTVSWSSSDAIIASVDQAGKVTAVKSGKATIIAKAGEKSATCEVTITNPVQSVSLDRTSVTLEVGKTTTLVATISPNDADENTVEWSSSNTSIVTLADGVVTAVAEGNASITAKVGGKSASCSVTVKNGVIAVTSVTLNKASLSLTKGQSETLTATVSPSDATDKTVSWSSSDATIASVDQAGKVTSMKSGKATITAKAGEKSATCEVTITNPVQSVSLDRTSVTLEVGKTTTLVATISPNDADENTVEWSTSNTSVVTVENGVVKAVAEGNATITAKVVDKSATCVVTVKNGVVAVSSVTMNKASLSLTKGQSETLTATVSPSDATDKKVSWSSSDATIASVDQAGKVTAMKSGKAIITAKAGEKSATCEIAVATPVESVSLNQTSITLEEGKSATLFATINPSDADEQTISWSTSNAAAATVLNGVITAMAEGSASITATVGGKSATCQVTVQKQTVPVTSVTLNKSSLDLTKGQSETLIATVSPENATEKAVTWSTGDATIATVDQMGKVTAMKTGEVTITAKVGEFSATCQVTVNNPVTSVSLDQTSVSLEEGQTVTLVATINPSDADEQTITWATNNAAAATVANGVVTAVAEGTATITATVGGKSATCEVTVQKNVIPASGVTLNMTSLTLAKGQSETLIATVSPDNATDKTVSWSSSDATIASVDQNGKVTALKSGKITITAKAGEKSATCEVTVTTPVESVSLDKTSLELEEGQTATLVATINPSDADEKTVTWSSSDATIASVDQNGKVTAVKEGEATITAKAGGKEAICKVTVTEPKYNTGDGGTEDFGNENGNW